MIILLLVNYLVSFYFEHEGGCFLVNIYTTTSKSAPGARQGDTNVLCYARLYSPLLSFALFCR